MNELINEVKRTIIESLNLEDISINDIQTEAPLFGDGLGLDSIDALELSIALQKKFNVNFSSDSTDNKKYYFSVKTLAEFITSQRTK